MAKPIRLTDELIQKMSKEFEENLRKARMSDGKITYTKAFTYPGKDGIRANIWFTAEAYLKMITLLNAFDTEVAWHGVVERQAEFENDFVISDILVYPQEVSGATVNTDQEGYQQWLMSVDDEVANHLHMQGHSHVWMKTSPSGTDLNHQEEIIKQLDGDMFYIFMIWNKRLERTIKVYDFKYNTLYEDEDCDVGVLGGNTDMSVFIAEAKAAVKSRAYNYSGSGSNYPTYGSSNYGGAYGGGSGYSGGAKGGKAETKPATSKPKSSASNIKHIGGNTDDEDGYIPGVEDYDDYVFNDKGRIGFQGVQERMKV